MIYIFPDTNFLLHYTFLDEINWSFISKDDVTVVISPNTYKEIDNHKHRYDDPRKQKRAQNLNRLLADIVDELLILPKNGVPIQILPSNPLSNYGGQLDLEVPDDRFIASVLAFREEKNSTCIILSNDTGVTLKCKQLNIQYVRPPEDLALLVKEDPLISRNKKLDEENFRLKNLLPKPALLPLGGKLPFKLVLRTPRYFTPDEVSDAVEHRRQTLKPINGVFIDTPLSTTSAELRARNARRYNEELQKYFHELQKFLSNISAPSKYDLFQRMSKLECLLVNSGTTPANELEIFLSPVTKGINLVANEPETIPFPTPPSEFVIQDASLRMGSMYDKLLSPSVDFLSPEWRDEGSGEIAIWIKKASHHEQIVLPTPTVIFDSINYMKSFKLNYRITADNLPDPLIGTLNFKVTLENS